MQRVLRFLAIYSKLKNKKDIEKKTKKYRGGGEIQLAPIVNKHERRIDKMIAAQWY
jgi:hypothetical protein